MSEDSELIAIGRRNALATITLNRASKLNAINSGMRKAIAGALPRLARDPQLYVVVIRAAPGKAFCAGGDIRELYEMVRRDAGEACRTLGEEYALTWTMECLPKPSVALIDGAVMGSGVGLTLYCTHRVAGEGYRFQMPETGIGFFPDDGVCHTFARMPHCIGRYLGLTGRSIGGADALSLGLVTHCISGDRFAEIEDAFAEAEPIDPVLEARHRDPGPAEIDRWAPIIERCFSAASVAEIVARLDAERVERAWCEGVAADLARQSPLALEVTLAHIRRAAALDLRATLMADHRIACRLVAENDFSEGVRALIVDKDGAPRWLPGNVADVGMAMVERVMAPLAADGLVLPIRSEMLGPRAG